MRKGLLIGSLAVMFMCGATQVFAVPQFGTAVIEPSVVEPGTPVKVSVTITNMYAGGHAEIWINDPWMGHAISYNDSWDGDVYNEYINTTGLADRTYGLMVAVSDSNWGNLVTAVIGSFEVDNVPPVVTISHPKDGDITSAFSSEEKIPIFNGETEEDIKKISLEYPWPGKPTASGINRDTEQAHSGKSCLKATVTFGLEEHEGMALVFKDLDLPISDPRKDGFRFFLKSERTEGISSGIWIQDENGEVWSTPFPLAVGPGWNAIELRLSSFRYGWGKRSKEEVGDRLIDAKKITMFRFPFAEGAPRSGQGEYVFYLDDVYYVKDMEFADLSSNFSKICQSINFYSRKPEAFYFIQITDTHIDEEMFPQNSQNFRKFIQEIKELKPRPSFVIITGDVINRGDRESWIQFHKLVVEFEREHPDIPFYITLSSANHDGQPNIYLELFPDRKPYYYYDYGGIRFISLSTAPHLVGFAPAVSADESYYEYLGEEQVKWLKSVLMSYKGKTVAFFLHNPPLSGDLAIRDIFMDLSKGLNALNNETEVWVLSGHWHSYCRFQIMDLREGNLVYNVVCDGILGKNEETIPYRIYFVEDGKITNIARKSGLALMLEQSPGKWKKEWFFYEKYNVSLFVSLPGDAKYLLEDRGCRKDRKGFLDVRGEKEGYAIYKVPLPKEATHLGVYALWKYLIDVSGGGKNWIEIANSTIPEKRYQLPVPITLNWRFYKLLIPLPQEFLKVKSLYIRFRDPDTKDVHPDFASGYEWFCVLNPKR